MPSAPKLDAPQGNPLFEVQFRAISESLAGNGVLSNTDFEVTAGAGSLEIDVAAGTAYYVATEYTYGGATPAATLTGGDATYDRWDTIAFDTATTSVVVHEGTAEQYPTPPDIASDELLLAIVYVPAGATDVADSNILNWRAKFSNESEEVHYDDTNSYWGTDNVEAVLDAAPSEFVQRDYATNSGALVLTDMPVDGNAAAGTEQSYTWSIDSTALLTAYAESDGAGGLQNLLVHVPNSDFRVGDGTVSTSYAFQSDRDVSGTHYRSAFWTENGPNGIWRLVDVTNGTTLNQLRLFQTYLELYSDIQLDTGETVVDYSNKHVPRAFIDQNAVSATVTSNTTTSDEEVIFADTSGGALTITLASADAVDGNSIVVVDVGGASATNAITIDTEGTENIDGNGSTTVESNYGSITLSSDGAQWYTSGGTVASDLNDQEFNTDESGSVAAGNSGVAYVTQVADTATLEVIQAGLILADGQPAPTDLDLVIATLDNAGTATKQTTVIAGDGTVQSDVTGAPVASYQNTSGGEQTVALLVDNGNFNAGTGASQDIFTTAHGQVVN